MKLFLKYIGVEEAIANYSTHLLVSLQDIPNPNLNPSSIHNNIAVPTYQLLSTAIQRNPSHYELK